ncbi:MAG: carbohydrate ABC transporter permease [Solirubrobacteraceae bacterium]
MSATTPNAAEAPLSFDGLTRVKPKRITAPAVTSNVVLGVIGALFALPLLWLVLASIDSHASWNIAMPHFTLSNFSSALSSGRGHSLVISAEIAGIATIVATVTGTLAAYAFSRRHIPWKGPVLLFVLFLSGVPISVIIIPVYQVFSEQGWLTVVPVAVFLGITALPFEIWIIKNFIDAVPTELEEAARVEGAGTATIIRRIVVPLAAPGIGAAAIYGFVNAWGAFLIPLVLITDSAQQPGAVTVYSFISAAGVNYGDIAAFSIVYSLPVVVLYLAMGRFFRGGFQLGGALKG